MRVFALSDLHADFSDNLIWLQHLSRSDFVNDALIVSGDICDAQDRFRQVLDLLRSRFREVLFVPGNHDVWVRDRTADDSLDKFRIVMQICRSYCIHTEPLPINKNLKRGAVWIVPLFSWYLKPEESTHSLFLEKPGEDPSLRMWSDNQLIRWPEGQNSVSVNRQFIDLNSTYISRGYDAPVISFSHFLPRKELMFSLHWDRHKERLIKFDRVPAFNFSRVAGTDELDRQIRELGSAMHIFGHQHRNRNRDIGGVRYISHCLGYPNERRRGQMKGIDEGPKLVWDESGPVIDPESY